MEALVLGAAEHLLQVVLYPSLRMKNARSASRVRAQGVEEVGVDQMGAVTPRPMALVTCQIDRLIPVSQLAQHPVKRAVIDLVREDLVLLDKESIRRVHPAEEICLTDSAAKALALGDERIT